MKKKITHKTQKQNKQTFMSGISWNMPLVDKPEKYIIQQTQKRRTSYKLQHNLLCISKTKYCGINIYPLY